eukprot:335436_1
MSSWDLRFRKVPVKDEQQSGLPNLALAVATTMEYFDTIGMDRRAGTLNPNHTMSGAMFADCCNTSINSYGSAIDCVVAHKLCTARDYPKPLGSCKGAGSVVCKPTAQERDYFDQTGHVHGDGGLQRMLSNFDATPQAVMASVDASTWRSYSGGIYNNTNCGNQSTHAVVVVGFAPDYWVIQNSWG